MKRLAILLFLAAALGSLPVFADCQNGAGTFSFKVVGPEAHDNLWQFATVRGWRALASLTSATGSHNHGRLVYNGTQYGVSDSPCVYGLAMPDGSTLVIVAEYVSDPNTTAQRGFVAAASFAATDPAPPIPDATMREVPPASAANSLGTITVTWTDLPAQPEIVGYRVVRSADGIAGWTTVADVAAGVASRTDTPGPGTFYYAVEIIYLNDGTNKQVSPHGLAAVVTIP